MNLLTINVLLILVVVVTTVAEPRDVFCCEEDVEVRDGVCVKDNSTTPVSLSCKTYVHITDMDFEIIDDGTMFLLNGDEELRQEKGSYCVWNRTSDSDGVLVICDDDQQHDVNDETVLGYCMFISGIFLMLTALVYCLLPDVRDLLGKSIINMCASMGIAQCVMAGMKLVAYSDMALCAARGFFAYYFFLSSFFWTNAISIQFLIRLRRPIKADYGWRRFLYYALYADGVPGVLTGAIAVVNFYPGRHIKPGIGLNHCWFIDSRQQWWYMYSVMSILILANIAIFFYLSIQLWKSAVSSSNIKGLKYIFLLTLKLIVVMGLPWVFELISSLAGKSLIWVVIDIFNALQGLVIFYILVVIRKRVIKALHKNGYLDCISDAVERYLSVGDDEEDYIVHHTNI
ncbi:G-protein coupled receptor Mth2-like [Aricia agestis]|uniref:G-protein coupled receptor Mth2-like n=1 Tax=Aricia agestis TaxID=91739 RepID=UPI001C204E80|nr:G-protein coupled receptor Mth2-like [Aricia agestis]